jgi:hypothetical protein
MLGKKIITGLVLLAIATTVATRLLLPTHLVALTSNVTAAPHPLSDVRRTAGSLHRQAQGGGKRRAGISRGGGGRFPFAY